MASDGDDTVVSLCGRKGPGRKPASPGPAVPAGPYFSPSLLPALERYGELLNRYGQRPGETCAADVFGRMHPADRAEAEQLAACLDPVLGPRILAAREA